MSWQSVLERNADLTVRSGSERLLADAIGRGADLRVFTEFRHNEHIDTSSNNDELVQEVSEFPVTCLLEDRWAAGIMTLRQPVALPDGFEPRPSMSFFLYNQNGQQAIARPHLDGVIPSEEPGPAPLDELFDTMPRYHQHDNWDVGTNAPSSNFIYDFETYRFLVRDDWSEVLSHTDGGTVVAGDIETLSQAFREGKEIKVAVRDLYADLADTGNTVPDEVFVRTHSAYYYTKQKLFIAGTHPVVRVKPSIPLAYISKGWDFGWLVVRTDGFAARLLYDPYRLSSDRSQARYHMRWFVR